MKYMRRTSILVALVSLLNVHVTLAQDSQSSNQGSTSLNDSSGASSQDELLPKDYKTLGHRIEIDVLRGGSYDKSGSVQYYFKGVMNAKVAAKEGPSPDGKRVETQIGTFGEAQLKALELWQRDPKSKGGAYELAVSGDLVRECVARAMLEWGVQESDVSISVEIEMMRRTKKFGVLGEDTSVARSEYQLMPAAVGQVEAGKGLVLSMNDAKGALAKISIRFDKIPIEAKKK